MLVIEPTSVTKGFGYWTMTYVASYFFYCNADSKDKGNFTIEREAEKWLLRSVREESQIKPLAKKLRLTTAFKGLSALHEN